MKKYSIPIVLTASVLLMSGCAGFFGPPKPPADVYILPNDCANRKSILEYYARIIDTPKSPLIHRDDYETYISTTKRAKWTLLHNCQRAN